METKTLCVLANSVKNQQSCVAGIEVVKNAGGEWQNTGRWIRPISHRPNGAISDSESYLQNKGRKPQLFDIVEVHLQAPADVEGQPEDWLIEPTRSWQHLGSFNPQKSITVFLEKPDNLWLQQNERHDRATPEWVAEQKLPSLYLVRPNRIKIYVQETDYGNDPKRSRRAAFHYRGVDYDFGMTDPMVSQRYFRDYQTRQAGLHAGIDIDCAGILRKLGSSLERGVCLSSLSL